MREQGACFPGTSVSLCFLPASALSALGSRADGQVVNPGRTGQLRSLARLTTRGRSPDNPATASPRPMVSQESHPHLGIMGNVEAKQVKWTGVVFGSGRIRWGSTLHGKNDYYHRDFVCVSTRKRFILTRYKTNNICVIFGSVAPGVVSGVAAEVLKNSSFLFVFPRQ